MFSLAGFAKAQDTTISSVAVPQIHDTVAAWSPLKPEATEDTAKSTQDTMDLLLAWARDTVKAKSSLPGTGIIYLPFFFPHLLHPPKFHPQSIPWSGRDISFAVLLLCFVFYSRVQFYYYRRVNQIFRVFVAGRYLKPLLRGGEIYAERVNINLFLVFLFTIPLLLIEISVRMFGNLYPDSALAFFLTYLIWLAIIGGLYAAKLIMVSFTGTLFKTPDATSQYLHTHFIFNLIEGLVMMICLVFIVFADSLFAIRLCLVLLAAVEGYRVIRGLYIGMVESKYSPFYLLIFFLSVELMPALIIAKAALKYYLV